MKMFGVYTMLNGSKLDTKPREESVYEALDRKNDRIEIVCLIGLGIFLNNSVLLYCHEGFMTKFES